MDRVCGRARAGEVGALETWPVVFWQASAMPARRRPGDGRSGEDDPAGRRAAREAATRRLSALLKRVQATSGVTWDELAETAHVSRSTVANYVGESVRRRDPKTVKSLLDGMNAPQHERDEALRLHRGSLDEQTPQVLPPVLDPGLLQGYLRAVVACYRVLDLAALSPEAQDEQVPVLLRQVFIAQQVRPDPPPVELPRDLRRRLLEQGDLDPGELPDELDSEKLAAARQAHLDQPPRPVWEVVLDPARRWVAVLGDPGAGKSSLLRYLAVNLAAPTLPRNSPTGRGGSRCWWSCAPTPIRPGGPGGGLMRPCWTSSTTAPRRVRGCPATPWRGTCAAGGGQ